MQMQMMNPMQPMQQMQPRLVLQQAVLKQPAVLCRMRGQRSRGLDRCISFVN